MSVQEIIATGKIPADTPTDVLEEALTKVDLLIWELEPGLIWSKAGEALLADYEALKMGLQATLANRTCYGLDGMTPITN